MLKISWEDGRSVQLPLRSPSRWPLSPVLPSLAVWQARTVPDAP
ncbi:hypothetical protein [Geitlerinema sp. PCC 7407]|nr:hypothetical protein [Geitlerinema sp. PCC 7407]